MDCVILWNTVPNRTEQFGSFCSVIILDSVQWPLNVPHRLSQLPKEVFLGVFESETLIRPGACHPRCSSSGVDRAGSFCPTVIRATVTLANEAESYDNGGELYLSEGGNAAMCPRSSTCTRNVGSVVSKRVWL